MKKKFWVLWSAGVVSTVIALPYVFTLERSVIDKVAMPLWQLVLVALAQTIIVLTIAVFFGLKLSQRINLSSLTIFESGPSRKVNIKRILKLSIPVGIALGVILKFLDVFFSNSIPQITTVAERIPFWKAILVTPYGGIVEELLMRLFLLSLIAWLLGKITRTAEPAKSNAIMWISIIVTAILFGLGHLPATASVLPITPIVIARALLLNGIGGLAFGWLYWKKGLEYGIVAHFTTDVVLIAILPVLLK